MNLLGGCCLCVIHPPSLLHSRVKFRTNCPTIYCRSSAAAAAGLWPEVGQKKGERDGKMRRKEKLIFHGNLPADTESFFVPEAGNAEKILFFTH